MPTQIVGDDHSAKLPLLVTILQRPGGLLDVGADQLRAVCRHQVSQFLQRGVVAVDADHKVPALRKPAQVPAAAARHIQHHGIRRQQMGPTPHPVRRFTQLVAALHQKQAQTCCASSTMKSGCRYMANTAANAAAATAKASQRGNAVVFMRVPVRRCRAGSPTRSLAG